MEVASGVAFLLRDEASERTNLGETVGVWSVARHGGATIRPKVSGVKNGKIIQFVPSLGPSAGSLARGHGSMDAGSSIPVYVLVLIQVLY